MASWSDQLTIRRHECQRCGASCQGLRVFVTPEEQPSILLNAEALGIERPLSGSYLRQNWGTCVFYADGCRLHAELGIDTKPAACRRFPEVRGIDPACFHPGDQASSTSWPLWDDLSLGLDVRRRLQALPLPSVRKANLLGPLTAEALAGMDSASPKAPDVWRARLDWRARRAAEDLPHHEEVERLLVGGGQLLCGLDRPGVFAAWVRLLRVLPQL